MAYEIVKDKPLPPRVKVGGRPTKYPFAEMEVGDAFCVPGGENIGVCQARVCTTAKQYVQNSAPDKKFTTRRLDGNVWVWRTA